MHRMGKFFLVIVIATFLFLMGPAPTQGAVLVVDGFDAGSQLLSAPCCAGYDSSTASDASILGGERDIEAQVTGGVFGSLDVFAGPSGNVFGHNQSSFLTGWSRIVWDGSDGDAATIDTTGLGGVDLTSSGSNHGFRVPVLSADLSVDLIFTVYTDGANYSTYTLSLPGSISNETYFLPFTGFSTAAGTGADFSNAGAIELFVDGSTSDLDITIQSLEITSLDFGDLPAGYSNTTLADDGARHIVGSLFLGTGIDGETDGQESSGADADSDEDGVARSGDWSNGAGGGSINATVTGGNGCLSAWIDWDSNNNFSDGADQVLDMAEVSTGSNPLTFDVPAGTFDGSNNEDFFIRFRLVPDSNDNSDCSDETAIAATGMTDDGEVEDYQWFFGPTAVTLQDTNISRPALPLLQIIGLLLLVPLSFYVYYRRHTQ